MKSLTPKSHAEAVAVFRHGVIGALTQSQLERGQLAAALEALAQQRFVPPLAKASRCFSAPTLERWYYAYKQRGLAGLAPTSRSDKGRAKQLAPAQRNLLMDIRREYPSASATLILRTLVADGRLAKDAVSATTVRRLYAETADANAGGSASVTFLERGESRPALEVVHTNTTHRFLTLAPSGTAYALRLDDLSSRLYASTDGARTWSFKARHLLGGSFRVMTSLADGTLLANTTRDGRNYLSRSGDGGTTWSEVLLLGAYRMLTPRNIAELDGTVYLIEYQAHTAQDVPLRLFASTDRGRTWQVRQTFFGHRHGHGLVADPIRHALWVFFGDNPRQAGTFRSTDAGHSWTSVVSGPAGIAVDATVLGDGSLLFGQDIIYLPTRPHIVQMAPDGTYVELAVLPGPAYSAFAPSTGGFVVGSAREPGGDVYPPGEESAHVWASFNGLDWEGLRSYQRLEPTVTVRADVYYELPSGLLILQLENAQGFGPGGHGYQLLRLTRRSAPP